ncbi:hypothetical protein Mal4_33840 [Maioricimonas rarisocia]|uniref:Uncharacterized protein n=1 Tax=Maioricimonas rarisocia TaxID=2528026 RepID=A0A517Z9C4_9PLAN|nr:hypothetical protein [Maioricimonas rarisocia]QDU39049.1 hypothetical protein Mal4_33840 [Maioricimonas rarisocia]
MKFYFLALGTLLIVCVGCAHDGQQLLHKDEYHAPPANMMAHPGPMVTGPGPGVIQPVAHAVPYMAQPAETSQVRFLGPEGMHIGWQIGQGFAENQLMAPSRYNFAQGATYRLKITGIPGREGLVLYPSLHVYPEQVMTSAYLAHNALPIRITDEDLDQIETNNFVTKVIYLPDAKYQELAIAGVEELVSTRLAPGLDPVAEADRRGTIMAVMRIGNMDLEMPGGPTAPVSNVVDEQGNVRQVSHVVQVNGEEGHFVPPVPVASFEVEGGVPNDLMVGGPAGPGQPAYNPISGVSGVPMWGYPHVGTPIGLPGPPHLPLGGPAGLRSHTVRNLTDVDLGKPVQDMLIDVRHEPGYRLPHPVKHVEYTETHPVHRPGEVSLPAWAAPQAGGAMPYPTPAGPHHH